MKLKSDWTVYYLVHSNFFAHAHLHRRKIDILRDAGIYAKVLAFVPYEQFIQNQKQYQKVMDDGVEIVQVISETKTPRLAAWFFIKKLFKGEKVLVHVLRNDPTWLIRLRRLPFIGKCFRVVLEYEGDHPEEFIYQNTFIDSHQPLVMPNASIVKIAEGMARRQTRLVKRVDGLVLMSKEHESLWLQRVEKLPLTAIVPSLHDPAFLGFYSDFRDSRREELNWSDKQILVYTGNVICNWQRFPALCRLIAQLNISSPEIRLLALVRKDDLDLAKRIVEQEGITAISCVLSVPYTEVFSYLCASDFGLYLRHLHPMNMVVASAKLGEYLACGLPVITTGANAKVLNSYIQEAGAGVFLSENLSITDDFIDQFSLLYKQAQDPNRRKDIAASFNAFFSNERDPLLNYRNFIVSLLDASKGRLTSTTSEKSAR